MFSRCRCSLSSSSRLSLLLVLLGVFAGVSLSLEDKFVVVPTSNGPVRGQDFGSYVGFRGVRFAAPPVGPLRWKAPEAPKSWTQPVNATELRPGCPQKCVLPPFMCPEETSEDCLFLNVFTPPMASSKRIKGNKYEVRSRVVENINGASSLKPVLVFVAGGAFIQGSSGVLAYDGRHLAEMGVVVVTISYRLSALGFLVPETGGGNFGFLDQRLALQWVRDNIANFGGDPSRVTFAGESAGAASVALHMTSPGSRGLFHRAIIESNPWALPYRTADRAKAAREKLYKDLGCSDIECMRSASVDMIVAAADDVQLIPNPFKTPLDTFLTWTPVIDGDLVPGPVVDAFRSGNMWGSSIPVLMGSNTNEGDAFVRLLLKKPISSILYAAGMGFLFGSESIKVLRDYPPSSSWKGDYNRATLSQLASDFIFLCPMRKVATATASRGAATYLYHFNNRNNINPSPWSSRYSFCDNLVCHGSELIWFNSMGLDNFKSSASTQAVAKDMLNMWANFVSSDDANPGSTAAGATWQRFSSNSKFFMNLEGTTSSGITDYRGGYCNMWDTTGEY